MLTKPQIIFIQERILSILGIQAPPVFYIGGSDTLPPPLERQDEEKAIAALDEGDEAARKLLIEHNLRLVVYISKRFENTGINIEDLISIGTIGLIKAVNTFKSSRNIKLATYASRCIENEILMYLRKAGSQRSELSFDEPLNTDWDGNELLLSDILGTEVDEVCRPLEDDAEKSILRAAVESLEGREKEIIILRFGLHGGKDYTQKEVADMLGISQSYISRLEKRIIQRLRREMIRQLLNETVSNGFAFRKFRKYDARGRSKTFALIEKINARLEEVMNEFLKGEADHISLLRSIDDIRGLLVDLFM